MFVLPRQRRSDNGVHNTSIVTTPDSTSSNSGSDYDMWEALRHHLKPILDVEEKICNMTILSKPKPTDGLYCPAQFDGWSCLNHTKAGATAFVNCPPLPIFNTHEKAFRHCTRDGTWELVKGRPWTNFTFCVLNSSIPEQLSHIHYTPIYLFLAGASLSLLLLVISLAIFFSFTQLRCDRVIIHQNLFVSLALTAISFIIYYVFVVMDGDVILANPTWCQVLHVMCQYFTTCNFSWMFCESLFLHIIMAHALTTGKKIIKIIIAAGWGVPILLTLAYALLRGHDNEVNKECWTKDDILLWIIGGPIIFSVVLNFFMLINLVRLLVTKLQQIPEASQSKKAAKAILILFPLFGLQLILFPVRPPLDSIFYDIYLHVMAFLMSSQGTFVSIIFCFCNGEVRSLVRRKWHQHLLMNGRARRNTALTSSTFGDPYSVVDTTREVTCHKTKITHGSSKDALELKPLTETPGQVTTSGYIDDVKMED